MIRGIHGLFYSSDPEATRAFFREKVRLPGSDIGDGWWIFDFAEGDMGVHPVDEPTGAGGHDISFYCDDIRGTVEDLKSRGVNFIADIEDHGYGWVTHFSVPGGLTVQLYEPKYQKAGARRARPQPARRATPSKRAGTAKRPKVKRRPSSKRAASRKRR